jgi:high-affinity nickel permease
MEKFWFKKKKKKNSASLESVTLLVRVSPSEVGLLLLEMSNIFQFVKSLLFFKKKKKKKIEKMQQLFI